MGQQALLGYISSGKVPPFQNSPFAIEPEVAYLKRRGRMHNEHTEVHDLVEAAVDGLCVQE